MINLLIPSKDRASQLRFLLESVSINMPSFFNEVRIIYTASNEKFNEGYEKLKKEEILPNIVWQEEEDFISDFFGYLESCESEYLCGMVDDCVVYKRIPAGSEVVEQVMQDGSVFCFSLRMGLNITVQNYLNPSMIVELRKYQENDIGIRWDWKEWTDTLNFGYPISLDGHIYRTEEIRDLSTQRKYDCLRDWEGGVAKLCRKTMQRNNMSSFKQSILFSIPSNCVQDPPLVSGQVFNFSPEEMNDRYLNNEVISFSKMQYAFQNVNWSHNEVRLIFEELSDA